MELTPLDGDAVQHRKITFGLGLTGYFSLTTSTPHEAVLAFQSDNMCLSLRSETPESFYFYEGDFDPRRSPDPIFEQDAFLDNLRRADNNNRQLLVVFLLNQRYFNGVGNYLRCELMHRLGLDLATRVADVDLEELGRELVTLLEEAYEVSSNEKDFCEWLQCYGKASNCFRIEERSAWSWKPLEGYNRVYQLEDKKLLLRSFQHLQNFMFALSVK